MVKRPFVVPLKHRGAISTFCLCDCFGLLCNLLVIAVQDLLLIKEKTNPLLKETFCCLNPEIF